MKFLLQQFSAGISDFDGRGVAGSFKAGQSLDIRKNADTLSCGQALVEEPAPGTFTSLAIFTVPADDGNTYFCCRDGKIIKRTAPGVYSLVYTDSNEVTAGGIKGAAEWFDSSGNAYLYWATDTRLNRKKLPGDAGWGDVNADAGWPKTNLTSATWHTMREAVGVLLIANDHVLAQVGYDNSYTNNALELINGNVAKTLIESGNFVLVGTYRKDNSEVGTLYLWDQISQNWLQKKSIPANGINAIVDAETIILQAGTGGGVYLSDLVNKLPLITFPGGGAANPDGTTNDDGVALFGIFGNGVGNTGVYSYGRRKKNSPFALNFDYPLTCDEIGSVVKVGTDILVTYKNGANYGVKKVDKNNKATAIYDSLDLKTPTEVQENDAIWNTIELLMKDLPSGCAVETYLQSNKSGNWIQATMEGNIPQLTFLPETRKAIFQSGESSEVSNIRVKLIPSGNTTPEVMSIKVFFE